MFVTKKKYCELLEKYTYRKGLLSDAVEEWKTLRAKIDNLEASNKAMSDKLYNIEESLNA